MKVIDKIKTLFEKKKVVETEPNEVETYIQNERMKLKLDAIKNHERNSFLYNWSQNDV